MFKLTAKHIVIWKQFALILDLLLLTTIEGMLSMSLVNIQPGAIEDYTQAIRLDLKYAGVYSNRGTLRLESGDHQGSIENFTQAIRLDPKYPHAYHGRGKARAALGDKPGAIEDYQKAASLYLEQNNTDAHKFSLQEIQKL
jgi:tetratricopeptide (TPR) repeat protein